jgi:hypothetical protein
MGRRVRDFGRFWFDFVVGDDWRIAAGIALVVVVAALVVHERVVRADAIAVGVPVVVVALVAGSILFDAFRAPER